MPAQQLYISTATSAEVDAYTTYGISLAPDSLSLLMTPPPLKDYIENVSALEHGRRILTNVIPKYDSREITLILNISAPTEAAFLSRYSAFCTNVLDGGVIKIRTSFQPTVTYHFLYKSCTSFAQYRMGVGKFSLKLIEPNPANRTA